MNRQPGTDRSLTEYDPISNPIDANYSFASFKGSLPMYSMHEALARDRMRESQQRSAEVRLARSLSAQRRWHRVAVRARAVSERHAQRASQVAIAR